MLQIGQALIDVSEDASVSGVVDTGGLRLVAIVLPNDWTAGDLTFQASVDNERYEDVYTAADAELNVAAGEDRYVVMPEPYLEARYLKIRSGTSGTPVVQAADRLLELVFWF